MDTEQNQRSFTLTAPTSTKNFVELLVKNELLFKNYLLLKLIKHKTNHSLPPDFITLEQTLLQRLISLFSKENDSDQDEETHLDQIILTDRDIFAYLFNEYREKFDPKFCLAGTATRSSVGSENLKNLIEKLNDFKEAKHNVKLIKLYI